MKKIILFLIPFLLTGCMDYNELNDLAIIVGIGIDYKDDKYEITYEVLSNNKDKEAANITSYTVTKSDSNFSKAINKTSNSLIKKPYFAHANVILLSEDIARNHLEEVSNYLLRSSEVRDSFHIIVNDNPKVTLSTKLKNKAVVSNSIIDTLSLYESSINKEFGDFIKDIFIEGKDTTCPVIKVDKDEVSVTNLAIFKNYEMINKLDKEQGNYYNFLIDKSEELVISLNDDDKIAVNIFKQDIKINITNDLIEINGTALLKLLSDININYKNVSDINKLEKKINSKINQKIIDLIYELKLNRTDILGFGNKYYIKTRNKNNDLWLNLPIKVNIKTKLAKKGIVYEVPHE